jgi:zinc transporter ZupT
MAFPYAILFGTITFFSTFIGGTLAIKMEKRLTIFIAFAAGVLVAVPLFDLLPESILIGIEYGIPVRHIMYVTAFGFIFLYFLERYLTVESVYQNGEWSTIRHKSGGLYAAIELSIHSFMDGVALGLGFKLTYSVGLLVAIAVISHDFSDGLNTVTVMLRSGNSRRDAIKMLLVDATTPFLGAVSTYLINIPESYLPLILPFFAGGFLYLGAGDLLPEANEHNRPLTALLMIISGFVLIYIIIGILT